MDLHLQRLYDHIDQKNTKIAELKADNFRLNTMQDNSCDWRESLEEEIAELKASSTRLNELLDEAEDKVKARNTQIADLKHRLTTRNDKIDKLHRKIVTELNSKLEKAGNRITEVSRGETETR